MEWLAEEAPLRVKILLRHHMWQSRKEEEEGVPISPSRAHRRGEIKDMIYKTMGCFRIHHPCFVDFLTEIKLIPRNSLTLRIPSSSWRQTDGLIFTTLAITGEVTVNE